MRAEEEICTHVELWFVYDAAKEKSCIIQRNAEPDLVLERSKIPATSDNLNMFETSIPGSR